MIEIKNLHRLNVKYRFQNRGIVKGHYAEIYKQKDSMFVAQLICRK
jgi:hypothetical protein